MYIVYGKSYQLIILSGRPTKNLQFTLDLSSKLFISEYLNQDECSA